MNRTIEEVLEDMQKCNLTRNYSKLWALIEEAKSLCQSTKNNNVVNIKGE